MRYHILQRSWESLFWGGGEEAMADCRSLFSGRTVWFSPRPWTSGPALHPLLPAGGSMAVCIFCLWPTTGFSEGPLGNAEVAEVMYWAIQVLCEDGNCCVWILSIKWSTFCVDAGLHQGCPLSLIVFLIFMNRISSRSRGQEWPSERFRWLSHSVTFKTHYNGSQLSAKLGWRSAPWNRSQLTLH